MSATSSIPAPPLAPQIQSLSRNGAIALLIRLTGAGGMLLSHIVLARCLGVSGFGEYAQAIAWLQILCVFGKLGLDNTSLRYVAEYTAKGEIFSLRAFLRDSIRVSALASILLMVGTIVVVIQYRRWMSVGLSGCLFVAAIMIPIVSIRQIQEASLRGLGLITQSQLSSAIWPLVLFVISGIAWLASTGEVASPVAALLHLISVGIVGFLVAQFVRGSRLPSTGENAADHREHSSGISLVVLRQRWFHSSIAFLLAESLIVLKSRVCVAIAGGFLGSESAGVYAAMERFADVSVLGSQSLGLVIAPQFATLFAAGKYLEMRHLMRRGQVLALAMTIPVALLMAVFGSQLFVLLGPGYKQGWTVLMTLLASASIASFAGPAAYVLQMTGMERTMLVITALCATVNVALSLSFIQLFGILGLGYAQMLTSLIWAVGLRVSLQGHPAWQTVTPEATRIADLPE